MLMLHYPPSINRCYQDEEKSLSISRSLSSAPPGESRHLPAVALADGDGPGVINARSNLPPCEPNDFDLDPWGGVMQDLSLTGSHPAAQGPCSPDILYP